MTHSNMLQILSNFMEIMSNNSIMHLISKLEEIESKEHCFQELNILNFLMYFYKLHLLVLLLINQLILF